VIPPSLAWVVELASRYISRTLLVTRSFDLIHSDVWGPAPLILKGDIAIM
jgi:hypothetical protein